MAFSLKSESLQDKCHLRQRALQAPEKGSLMGARVDTDEQVQREKNHMKLGSVPDLQNHFLKECFLGEQIL